MRRRCLPRRRAPPGARADPTLRTADDDGALRAGRHRADVCDAARERAAGARASWSRPPVIDALFLRQVWAGNETMLLELLRDESPTRAARGFTTSCSTRGPGRGSTTTEPFVAGAPAKPAQANFYPAGATKEEVEEWIDDAVAGREQGARHRLLHDHPPRARTASVRRRAVQPRVPGRAGARGARCCARRRR